MDYAGKMTREEVVRMFRKEIECLSHAKCKDCILEKVCDPMKTPLDSEYIEAYGMAIKALEQEPCEDTISRQAAIDACDQSINLFEAVDRLKELPPVTQKSNTKYRKEAKRWKNKWLKAQKSGHWIKTPHGFKCSKCLIVHSHTSIYCPSCGAKMVEPQERSDKK